VPQHAPSRKCEIGIEPSEPPSVNVNMKGGETDHSISDALVVIVNSEPTSRFSIHVAQING